MQSGRPAALGFGAMRMPDIAKTIPMVDAYLASGNNYFDTAWVYEGSEEGLRKTLVERHPRDSFLLANKIPPWEVKDKDKDMERLLQESLARCGTDYFDFYLVHSIDDSREQSMEDMGVFDYVLELKKRGIVKHVGFSFHGSTAYLERVLQRHPAMEFVQLQLNYMDVLRGPAGEWQDLALKYNKPIIIMEPIKGGSLASLPAPAEALLKAHAPQRSIASWAIQYAANLQGTTVLLSGMSNLEQIQDNLGTYEKHIQPLTAAEKDLLEQVLAETAKVANIPCTACKYCHKSCPKGIDIASCFSLYNELKRGSSHWNRAVVYRSLDKKADDCVACGACMAHCPQHIDIVAGLKEVAAAF